MESNRWGFRFVEADIASFEARIKHMGIISLYEGTSSSSYLNATLHLQFVPPTGTATLLPALLPSTEPREAIRLLRDARVRELSVLPCLAIR
jgi:hypothetical protein